MTLSASQRRERLLQLTRRSLPAATAGVMGTPAVHRRAVLAGAPSSLPDPRQVARTREGRREAMGLLRQLAFVGARRARVEGGTGVVRFAHPGAEGHERCTRICVSYA